ncbi:MAG TPA: response regulator transcription factor [Deltaproteobacteria bacterium]|nr:response regulator transcription factor [Deltaproteobacteria bacterium]HOM28172.1 response regulator transcription factor [Deltaproteobacteria bacterium]HPP79312.1 response regulator transcription factor [Deltaproteobacteria bacterium]
MKTPRRGPGHRYRILVVDDHPIFRHGLAQLISQEDDLEVCGEAEDYHDALKAASELLPDLIVVDITLKETSGIELIKEIHRRFKEMPMLVISMHDETLYAERTLRAGARGYIMKQEASENVISAIRKVLSGGIYTSHRITDDIMRRFLEGTSEPLESPLNRLTDRELEIFRLIGEGLSISEIGRRLHLSVKTVGTHRERIKEKLNLKSATELLRYALHWVEQERVSGS